MHTITYEVRVWNTGTETFHSVRVVSSQRVKAMTVPLAHGENFQRTVLKLLRREGILPEGKHMSLATAAGEALIKIKPLGVSDVTRRRMLHNYGLGAPE